MSLGSLPPGPVYVSGHRGMVGSALWRLLSAGDASTGRPLVGWTSEQLDLRDRRATLAAVASAAPSTLIDAAARVGGIGANVRQPVDFISDNLQIQVNLLDAAHAAGVERLLFLGSSCIYPRLAPQPIRESALLTGPLEPTNEAYAVAKIAGVLHVRAMRAQHAHRWISAMPTNLYGPGDSFDVETSHVLPAMIRRFHEAVVNDSRTVTIWGTGRPRREFLHVDDLARACVFLLANYDGDEHVNIGVGEDLPVLDLAHLVAEVVGFQGRITTDPSRPDGTPRKLLDVSRITELGWKPRIRLEDGIRATYQWYRASLDQVDVVPSA